MKVIYILFLCFVAIGCSMARKITFEDDKLDINSRNNSQQTSSSLIEPRKHKPYHDLFLLARKAGFSTVYTKPLHGIALMGGLQSLVGFVIIKIKIVLVTLTVIGAVALALKIFGVLKYTGFLYKNDYPPVGPPPEYHGYPGPPPHPPISFDHGPYSSDTYGNDWPSYAEHYARSMVNQFPIRMNMTEIVYSFMHVDKIDCRSRLVCELEMMMSRSLFFNYFMRHAVKESQPPSSQNRSQDCTTYYKKCVESSAKRLDRRRRRSRVQSDDSR